MTDSVWKDFPEDITTTVSLADNDLQLPWTFFDKYYWPGGKNFFGSLLP
jgi:hypothetical protein